MEKEDKRFPDINELFNIGLDDPVDPSARRQSVKGKKRNYLFDLEKVDMKEFDRLIAGISQQFKKSDFGAKELTKFKNPSNVERRQLPHHSVAGDWGKTKLDKASLYLLAQKLLDTMLTLVYMGRHRLRELEMHPKFDSNNPYYKFAFLYVKLNKMRRGVHLTYTAMKHVMNLLRVETPVPPRQELPNRFIGLHNRAMAIHTEFTYVWWVYVRLHDRFCNKTHIYMTRPTTDSPEEEPSPKKTQKVDT